MLKYAHIRLGGGLGYYLFLSDQLLYHLGDLIHVRAQPRGRKYNLE